MTISFSSRAAMLAVCALACAMPAQAELPEGMQAMIDAALASGDDKKIATALELARKASPGSSDEIKTIETAWKKDRDAKAALAKAKKEEEIRTAGMFQRWSGEGQLGASRSTGNTDSMGLTAGLKLKREGLAWTHLITASADYLRSSGTTSREKFLGAYEPRYDIGDDLFAYGLAQYERNRIQGFDGRYAVSGGLGYKVVDTSDLSLSVKAGPAFRITDYIDEPTEKRLGGLAAFDLDWKILDTLSLTQDASMVANTGAAGTVIFDSANTTLNLVTGLDAKISNRLRSRISYAIDYDSNPADGAVKTDTATRFSLVYGF